MTDSSPGDNSLGRLLTLSDGVFAIAMTLLALDLQVPELRAGANETELLAELGKHVASYLSFTISFFVVASYWSKHRRFLKSADSFHPRLQRDTLLLLFVVAALPFPASLLGRYGGTLPFPLALYGAVNATAIVFLLAIFRDVTMLGPASSTALRRTEAASRTELIGDLTVFLLCIPAAYVLGRNGPWLLLLLTVSGNGSKLLHRNRAAPERAGPPVEGDERP